MDALSDVLRVIGLTGGIFLEARFTAPWCVTTSIGPEQCKPFMTPPPFVIGFHYIVEGECLIAMNNEAPVQLRSGDVVLLPHNEMHKMGNRLDMPVVDASQIVPMPSEFNLINVQHGGGGTECHMVCGFLGGDAQLQPLTSTLPRLLKSSVRDTPGGEWIAESFRFGARQLANSDPGASAIISKMSELMFVEALRRYLTTIPSDHTGLLAGLRDPTIGKALALMHANVAREWTAEDLAAAVNLSRSAFADRFTSLLGQPPMKYLTNWRMQVAMHKLREGRLSIGQIAFDVGYESEAAFTRAFKREMGVPPATWRKQLGVSSAA